MRFHLGEIDGCARELTWLLWNAKHQISRSNQHQRSRSVHVSNQTDENETQTRALTSAILRTSATRVKLLFQSLRFFGDNEKISLWGPACFKTKGKIVLGPFPSPSFLSLLSPSFISPHF